MPSFDVFLSHNGSDKPTARKLTQALASHGLYCWLDEEQLRPGLPWQNLLEQGIKGSASVVVCVAADGLGPWEDEEMQIALRLAVKDGRPVIPVLLPGAPDEPELPMFLGNRTWVDIRGELGAEAIARLVWGITGHRPSERIATAADTQITGKAPTPSDVLFLDEIFDLLYSYPTVILLGQDDREQRAGLDALREGSRTRFGADRVLHLVPPRNPEASEAEFFRTLGGRAGMNAPAQSAMDFEDYLEGRLAGGERLFLLVSGLGKCSDTGRQQLADTLRGLFDFHGDALKAVLAGDERLAELKYAQGDLSLLSHAEPCHWPELNTGDVMDLARHSRPTLDLSPEDALTVLEGSGGHPRLIREALRCRAKGTALAECIQGLTGSRQLESQLTALVRKPEDARKIAGWLEEENLGPYREWIPDPLLRHLYWRNLLRADGPTGSEQLVWRCPAIVEVGRRLF
jgi:hypothetical protein